MDELSKDQRYKQILKFIGKLLITVILLIWVFRRIDLAQFGETVRNAQWRFLWVVWGLTILSSWLLSISMRLILKRLDCHADTGTLFGASAVTSLYGMVLPGALDMPVKWYIIKHHTGKGSHVLSSMVYNQFSMTIVTGIFALLALIASNPTGNWKIPVIFSALLVFLIVICLLLLNRTIGPKFTSCIARIIKPLPASFRNTGSRILGQLSVFQTTPWSFHLMILFLNFVSIIIVGTAIYIFAAKAAGINVPIGVLMWLCVLIFILGRLPVFIAGLGIREATLIGMLDPYGVSASLAVLMSMIIFSCRILMVAIGAIFHLYWSLRKSEK